MSAVALVLAAAAVAHAAALALRIPSLPLLIAGGILLRATGLIDDPDMLQSLLLLGVTVVVFLAGTELNPKRFASHGAIALPVGLLQFAVMGGAGLGLGLWWGLELQQSAFVALALAASSTFVVVRMLKASRQFHEPFGRMVLGVLLVQDVLVVLAVAGLLQWNDGLQSVESALLRSGLLLLAAWIWARSIVPWLLTARRMDDEAVLIVVLGILFVFLGAAHMLGVPMITGAFAAGFAVSSFPVNAVIRGQLTTLSDFFIAVFLTALGASLVLPSAADLALALAMVGVVVIVTPPFVAWFAERSGMSSRSAIESGLLLAQTSELSLVVVLLAADRGILDRGLLGAIVLTTVLTMILTQLIATDRMTLRLLKLHPSRFRRDPEEAERCGHIVLLGCGANTEPLVVELIEAGLQVLVVDDDPAVDAWVHRIGGIPIRGDGVDPEVLRRASVGRARAVISTLRRPSDNCRVIAQAGGTPVLVRVFEQADVDRIAEAGGIPVRYADAAAERFVHWFEEFVAAGDAGRAQAPPAHPDSPGDAPPVSGPEAPPRADTD